MLRRILVVAASALVVVGLTAAPSAARSKTIHDGKDQASYDIRRAKITYAKRAVRTRVFMVLASDQRLCVVSRYGKKRAKVRYAARACATVTGHMSHRLTKITPHGAKRIKCRGMRAHWRQNTSGMISKITVPRRCSPKMGKRASRFKVFSYAGAGQSDHTRSVKVRRG